MGEETNDCDRESRRREDAAIRLEQRFVDFIEKYKENQQATDLWRIQLETRLKPLEEFIATLQQPARFMKLVILLLMTPLIGVIGWAIFKKVAEFLQGVVSTGR